MTGCAIEPDWMGLSGSDFLAIGIFLGVASAPYIAAVKQGTSVALATVLSLLLVTFYQMVLGMGFLEFDFRFLSLIPAFPFAKPN